VDHIIQLGLSRYRKSDSADPTVQIVWLIDQLLELISENLVEDDDSTLFRSRLEQLRRDILDVGGIKIASSTALNMLNLCSDEFKRSRSRRTRRDEHFAEIILLLRKALTNLTGESQTFHDTLHESSERIRELIEVKDIQELKLKVAAEVNELNRVVREKHQREQVQFAQLSEQVTVLQRKLEAAKAEASIDGLTGIANRRNFDFTIQRWVISHQKSEDSFSVAIFDIDNFTQINDGHGHQIGDRVLISAALELGRNIRSNDFLARYGGDEFVILAAGMKLSESEKRFSNLLRSIQTKPFEYKSVDNKTAFISITASCGVAEYALGESAKELIHRADEAMYEAKREGKNRVVSKKRPLLSAYYEGRKRNNPA
jgi:diguanylate cyclase (GGDEF)-like protein